ncbi:hypothetical protein A6302_04545 [Methylobrevis pamukkalensis]|uniref:Uncharacterized protein n=1 Tax=Methylobrevis pamukkalensis TaxID=1439726 RepID=A0A1E3GN13_9HYPH|nr:hypothetical protein A6302_04545 [Methylobrevis pamukkalensis]
MIGALASPAAAGAYFVATRLANAFTMVAGGLNGYSASRISALHFGGGKDELHHMMRSVMAVALLLVTGLGVGIVVFGSFALGLFSAAYVDVYPALLVLSAAPALPRSAARRRWCC